MIQIFDTPEQIANVRLLTLRKALELEIKGLKGRFSAYQTLKKEYNLKGNKQSVLQQINNIIDEKGILRDKKL